MYLISGKGTKKFLNSLTIIKLTLKTGKNCWNCWIESSWVVFQNVIQMLSEKSDPTSFLVDNMHVTLPYTSLTKRWSVFAQRHSFPFILYAIALSTFRLAPSTTMLSNNIRYFSITSSNDEGAVGVISWFLAEPGNGHMSFILNERAV